jgi:hypothetical protein
MTARAFLSEYYPFVICVIGIALLAVVAVEALA